MFDVHPQEAEKVSRSNNPEGRDSLYDPEICQDVQAFCERGATDEEIAEFIGVSTRTLYRWKARHSEFCQAIQTGKIIADERVERSLYQMATGTYVKEQQAHKVKTVTYDDGKRSAETEEIKLVEVERYMPPEVPAAIFWLKNRRKEQWRDRQDHEHLHKVEFSAQLETFLRALHGERTAKAIEKPTVDAEFEQIILQNDTPISEPKE